MAVNQFQERALGLILKDPKASKILQQELHRIDPTIPLQDLPDVAFEERLSEHMSPLQEEMKKLREELAAKKQTDYHEMEAEKLRKLGWTEAQITELRERMLKDPDNNLYGSYLAAARYYQGMDQPLLPSGQRNRDMNGRFKGAGDKWREDFKDKESPLRKGRQSAREYAQQE